jgi:NAD(P)H-hydrate epimerase
MPSGLYSNDNSTNDGAIIKATYTLTFQLPKLAFLFAENEKYTGEWHLLPIGLDENSFISRKPIFN